MRERLAALGRMVARWPRRRALAETAMAEEMRAHLEHRIQQQEASGLAPAEARAAALRQFGNAEAFKEACRDARGRRFDNLLQDARLGLRLIRRQPRLAAVTVITVALGVGLNVAVFSAARTVLLDDLPYRDADRLVEIWQVLESARPQQFSTSDSEAMRQSVPALTSIAGVSRRVATVRGKANVTRASVGMVTPDFFGVFGVEPIIGRTFGESDFAPDARPAVLAHETWLSQFGGDRNVLGRSIYLDGQVWTVVGIMPRGFSAIGASGAEMAAWTPQPSGNDRTMFSVFARLASDVTPDQAQSQVDALIRPRQSAPAVLPGGRTLHWNGVALERVGESQRAEAAPGLWLLQSVAALLLFITCANLGNLFLAQAVTRYREFGMRAALGARQGRIVRQVLTEAGILAIGGAAVGTAFAVFAVSALGSVDASILPAGLDVALRWPDLLLALSLSLLTALAFSAVPAVVASRLDPRRAIRRTAHVTSGRGTKLMQTGLVATQVLLSLVVLIGAGLLLKSFAHVMAQPLGFDPAGVAAADLMPSNLKTTDDTRELTRQFEMQLAEHISGPVAFGSVPYGTIYTTAWMLGSGAFEWNRSLNAEVRSVSPSYFDVLRVPVERGRAFLSSDSATAAPVAIVNRAFVARFATGRDLVGTEIQTESKRFTIVGIAGDVRSSALAQLPRPAVYVSLDQWPDSRLSVAIRTPDARRASQAIAAAARAVDPDLAVVKSGPLGARVLAVEARRRFYLFALSLFAGVSAALTVAGIYGVTAHVASQRTRELGIRLVLGGTPFRLKGRMLVGGLLPVAIGLAAGLSASWLATTALQKNTAFKSQLYQITSHDPGTFAGVTFGLFVVAAIACWLPARVVDGIAPASVLKTD